MRSQYLKALLVILLFVATPVFAQDEEAGEGEGAAPVAASQYIDLKPSFIANFGGPGKLRYLKADITLRVEANGISSIRHHMPYIRHALVMLLSRQSSEDISSMEGKELLRQNCLEAVRTVLLEEDGEQQVVDLLFSSFVVQL
jgi:flagellar FliL protein